MPNSLDPQVQAAIANGGFMSLGAALTGFWSWMRANRRSTQEQRCERVCANMIAAVEALLAVVEAVGAPNPALTNTIINARVQIDHARAYLNGDV